MKTSITATFESYCSHPFLNMQKAPVHALGIAHATIWEALHSCYTRPVSHLCFLFGCFTRCCFGHLRFSVMHTRPFWKLYFPFWCCTLFPFGSFTRFPFRCCTLLPFGSFTQFPFQFCTLFPFWLLYTYVVHTSVFGVVHTRPLRLFSLECPFW